MNEVLVEIVLIHFFNLILTLGDSDNEPEGAVILNCCTSDLCAMTNGVTVWRVVFFFFTSQDRTFDHSTISRAILDHYCARLIDIDSKVCMAYASFGIIYGVVILLVTAKRVSTRIFW